jgi:uroporphyrinogen-III synthase
MSSQNAKSLGLIVNTRPNLYHERFHEAFGDLPWAIYDCPLTRAEPVTSIIPSPEGFDSIVFTSQAGVDMFFYDPRWHAKRVFAVGEATGQMAAKFGYRDVISTGEDVEDMRRYLKETPFKKAIYPSAVEVTAELEKEFPNKVERVPIYKMTPRTDLPSQFIAQVQRMRVVAPIFSRRNAEIFVDLLTRSGITKENSFIVVVGMSEDVFAGLDGAWQRTVIAAKPTLNYVVAATDMTISKLNG